jgi:hypothetical protein
MNEVMEIHMSAHGRINGCLQGKMINKHYYELEVLRSCLLSRHGKAPFIEPEQLASSRFVAEAPRQVVFYVPTSKMTDEPRPVRPMTP